MNIQFCTTKTGKKGYILKGAYIGIDSLTGEQVRTDIRGKTKTEVGIKFSNKVDEFEKNDFTTKKKESIKTFNELIDSWLIYYEETVKNGTLYNTKNKLDVYIRPMLGSYKLDKITPALMQNKINDFISGDAKHIKDYKAILALMKRIFKYGVSLELFMSNPMDRTLIHSLKDDSSTQKEIKYYNKEELKRLLECLSFGNWKKSNTSTYLRLLVFTGMRANEALALYWSDIDFNEKTVAINKTFNGLGELVDTPKTKSSIRIIEIDQDTLNILNKFRKIQSEKSWELGIKPPKFIFYNLLKQDV